MQHVVLVSCFGRCQQKKVKRYTATRLYSTGTQVSKFLLVLLESERGGRGCVQREHLLASESTCTIENKATISYGTGAVKYNAMF